MRVRDSAHIEKSLYACQTNYSDSVENIGGCREEGEGWEAGPGAASVTT